MPLDLTRIRAICFDVDGTLSDTDDQFVQRLVKLLSPLRQLVPNPAIRKFARKLVMATEGPGNWSYSLADRIGIDGIIVALGDRLYQLGISRSQQPFVLMTGCLEMLAKLCNDYPLSIISARGQKSTFRFLHQFDLLPFFVSVATGQTCTHTKPYTDPLLWVADKMGVNASSCVMVGDTVVDILCAKKAGAQSIGVLCGFGERKELEHVGADLILDHTAQLYDLLAR